MENFTIWNVTGKTMLLILLININLPLESQTSSDSSAPQFLYSGFSTGKVKMKNGNIQTAVLNYNTVSEKMVYEKNGQLYDITNIDQIDTVFLQNNKFVPVGNVFHEVLLIAPISLLVQYKGTLLPAGTPAGYGGTSQVSSTKMWSSVQLSSGYYNLKLPSEYIVKVDPVFWIRKDNEMLSFTNERQFLKLFPDVEGELKKFIKLNRIKFDRLQDLVSLIGHCNESIR